MTNTVTITNLSNDGTYTMPFDLEVSYATDEDGLEVAIVYSGYAVSPQNAPQPGNALTFRLDWVGTVTGTTVTAVLQEKSVPPDPLANDERTNLTFLGGPP